MVQLLQGGLTDVNVSLYLHENVVRLEYSKMLEINTLKSSHNAVESPPLSYFGANTSDFAVAVEWL